MGRIYVTTDAFEAEVIIENTRACQTPRFRYYDIDLLDGFRLAKQLEFNPMSSVEIENISSHELDSIVVKLTNEGLYVATEFDGKLKKYIAHDSAREAMVRLALQESRHTNHKKLALYNLLGIDPCSFLLLYSNSPDRINDFGRNNRLLKNY